MKKQARMFATHLADKSIELVELVEAPELVNPPGTVDIGFVPSIAAERIDTHPFGSVEEYEY